MKKLRDIVLGAAAAVAVSLSTGCAGLNHYSAGPWGDGGRYRCEIVFSPDDRSDAIVLQAGHEVVAARDHHVSGDGEHHWMYRFYSGGRRIAVLRGSMWDIRASDAQEYLEIMREAQGLYKVMMECERRLQEVD